MTKRTYICTVALVSCACLSIKAGMVLMDGTQKMSGINITQDPDDAANKVMFWKNAPKGFRRPLVDHEVDLSNYNALSFRFYSSEADNHGIVILADSTPDNSDGGNYFSTKFIVDWKGWKTITIPFEAFSKTRMPVGWNKIDKIMLANSGYNGTKPNLEAEYYIDDVEAVTVAPPPKEKATEDLMLMDGTQKMSGISIEQDPDEVGNKVMFWKNAPKGFRRALVDQETDLSDFKALSFRFYSEEADNHGIVVLADSNPDNWDGDGNYYSKKVVVDWVGWKTITIPFNDFDINRKPVGWNKINSIMLANYGYYGTKPNTNAHYYVDDVEALIDAPPPKTLAEGEVVSLSSSNSSEIFQFPMEPGEEQIYGIEYQLKGQPGAQVIMRDYRTWDDEHNELQKVDIMGHRWNPQVSTGWETNRMEVLTRKGAGRIQVAFALSGDIPVDLRNVKVVKGGFPNNPPLKEAPYLEWIDGLEANLDYAANSPLLIFEEGGENMWEYKKLPKVFLDDEQLEEVEEEVAPYMALSVEELIELTPTRRPFAFNSGCWGLRYDWDPANPDVIVNKKSGEVFEPLKLFPIEGYDEVVAPSGKTVRYAYHDYQGEDEKYNGQRVYVETFHKGDRIYVDRFMTDVRLNALSRAGTQMAMLYRKTGNMEYGVRSAAILWAIARNMPDWPVNGQSGWNSAKSEKHLQSYDYYSWFSFVMGGNWYVTEGNVMWLARYFDLIRDTGAWTVLSEDEEIKDPCQDVADGLLHIARMYLKRDAFYRNSEFVTFHNLSGTENRSLMLIGRVVGCPDLIHYTMRRIAGAFQRTFMSDGVFPESPWYTMDQFARQSQALDQLVEYSDPDGYVCELDGTHLDIDQPEDSIPCYARVKTALDRQSFPDGSLLPVHDSWSKTSNPPKPWSMKFPNRLEVEPYLFSAYGHGILARGKEPFRFEGHLHFGGHYNHGHRDLLNLILWASGDELLSDIGYSHITQYTGSSFSHNLVMVDGTVQKASKHSGNLLLWNALSGSSQVIQADQGGSETYPECSIYRRTLVLLPFGEEDNALLDIFEVEGGSQHDWLAHGCRDYEQTLEATLKPIETVDNLASNGVSIENPMPWGDDHKKKYSHDEYGEKSIFYGAFCDVEIAPFTSPWMATMSPTAPVTNNTPDTAWAGPRAREKGQKPSLRLHWLEPLDGTAYMGETPRNRYKDELQNKPAASAVWAKNRTKTVMVRCEGEALKSTFVAAWEPFNDEGFLEDVVSLTDLKGDGFGWRLAGNGIEKTVLYRPTENKGKLSVDDFESDGAVAVKSEQGEEVCLDLYGGSYVKTDKVSAELTVVQSLKVKSMYEEDGVCFIEVDGEVANPKKYSEQLISFSQPGESSRWVYPASVESKSGVSKIVLQDHPGFTFDAKTTVLAEQFFPHRKVYGEASIKLPSWVNLKVSEQGSQITIKLRASNKIEFTLPVDSGKVLSVKRRASSEQPWKVLEYKTENNELTFTVVPTVVSDEWVEIKVERK